MSTEPATSDAQSRTDTRTTAIAARGRTDPWTDAENAGGPPAAAAPRQFEPACRKRLRNLIDGENAYCN